MRNLNQPILRSFMMIPSFLAFVGFLLFSSHVFGQLAPNAQYATFSGAAPMGDDLVGSGSFNCAGAPTFEYTISGDFAPGDTSVPGPAQVIDNNGGGAPGIETIYGQADAADNIEVEVAGFFGPAGSPISNTVVTTIDFAFPTTPGELAFIIADVEQDQVQVCALDAMGFPVNPMIISTWFQESFDADNSDGATVNPTWTGFPDNTLVGQQGGGVRQTVYQPDLPDNEAGAAWFEVNVPITQLQFKSQALGIAPDDPSQHFILASRCNIYDQAIIKEVATPAPYIPGQDVTYDITVCNQGNIDSGVLEVTDIIPAGMTLSTADTNGWAGPLAGPVTNTTNNITPGNCQVIPIVLTIDPSFMASSLINNVIISMDNGFDVDSDPAIVALLNDFVDDNDLTELDGGDDEDPELIMVDQIFDLALIKEEVSAGPYMPGDDVTYTITVCNQGTLDGSNIQITDFIPVGMTLSTADANGWAGPLAGPVTNTITSVLAGTAGIPCPTIDIVLTIDPSFTGTTLSNNAVISQDNGNDIDSDPSIFSMVDDFADDDIFTEADGGDDEDPELITVEQIYDLALIKEEASIGPYMPGDDVTYTITVMNQGTLNAGTINITDFIPVGMTLSTADANGWAGPLTGPVTNTLTGPNVGASTTVDIILTIDPAFMGTSLVNFAEISSDSGSDVDSTPDAVNGNDPGGAPNSPADNELAGDGTGVVGDTVAATDEDDHDPEMIMIGQMYDLALIKEEASMGPYMPGDDVTYTITIENQGTLNAGAIQITDFIPAGMMLSPADANGWAGPLTGPVVNSITGPAVGASMTIDIILRIDPTFPGGTIVNFAEISSDSGTDVDSTPDPINGNDAGGAVNTAADDELNGNGTGPVGGGAGGTDEDDHDPEDIIVQIFDLALNKTLNAATPGPFMPGSAVTFDLTVFNQGTIDAFAVELIDYIPAGLILADANWSLVGPNAVINSPISFIPAGGSAATTITFIVDPAFMGMSILNDSEINAADDDTNPGNTPPTDIDSAPGDNVTPADTPNNDDVADTAGGDDQDPEMIPVVQPDPIFDLALMKTLNAATPGPFAPGDVVTFDLTVLNQGAVNAFNVGLVDYIPAGLILADANWTLAGTMATLNSPISFIAAGGSATTTITFQVDPTFTGTSIVNDSEISMADDDTNPANAPPVDVDSAPGDNATPLDLPLNDDVANTTGGDDQDPEEIPVVPPVGVFDLALNKTLNAATPGPFAPGDVVTFDLTVFNQGTIDAFAIGLIDYIPAGLILADANWTAAGATATLNSPIPFISAGGTGATTITFQVDPTFTGTTIVNDSEISMADDDTNPGNAPPVDIDSAPGDNVTPTDTGNNDDVADTAGGDDQDPEMIPVVPPVGVFDLALNKTLNAATPGPFAPGDVVTFDLTVFNQGTIDAFAIGLIDYIPAGLILADANWTAAGATATLNSPIPFIAAGGTGATTITFQVDPTFTGTTIVNDSEISMADDDTNPGNAPPVDIDSAPGDNVTPTDTGNNDDVADTAGGDDQDPEMIPVVPPVGVFDLALNKTLNAATPGPFAPGDVVTFDLTVFNQGTIDAFAIGLIDYIPAGLILADANWTAAGATATLNSPIPFIAAGGTGATTITFQVDPTFTGTTIVNDSEISMADDDTNPGNAPPVDIDSAPGDNVTPTDTGNNDDVADTAGGDDQDPEMIPVVPPVGVFDLALNKTLNAATPGPFAPGDVVTFDLTVFNQGTIDAFAIGLIDYIPAGLILADANWTAAGATATLNSPIPFIAAGGTGATTITFQVDPTFTGTTIVNDSEISMADDDTNPGNAPPVDIDSAPGDNVTPTDTGNNDDVADTAGGDDQDPEMIPVVPPVGVFDLALNKTLNAATPGPFAPGDVVTFDLTVFNQGTIDAFAIGLIDYIPAGLILADANWTAAGATATLNSPIPFIAAGGTGATTITFQVDPTFTGTTIVNDSEISMADDDTNPGNAPPVDIDSAPGDNVTPTDTGNNDDVADTAGGDDQDPEMIPVVPPVGVFDLALNKTLNAATPGPFAPGDVVTFDLTVFNQGTIDAFAIGLIDYIPAGLILADANWTAAGATATLNSPIPFIAAGGTGATTITFQVDPTFTGTTIVNDSEISMADDDTNPGNAPPVDIDSAPGDNVTPTDTGNNDDVADTAGGDDQDPEMIPVVPPVGVFDLALNKTLNAATPGPFAPGDVVTFDLTVFNQGTIDAFAIGLIDYIPAGLILADANWTAAGATATLNSPIPFIAAGGTGATTITFQVDPTFTGTTIVNDSEISMADDDTNPGNAPPVDIDSAPGDNVTPTDTGNNDDVADTAGGDDQDPEMIPVVPPVGVFDLALNKTLNAATPGPFAPGDVVTFDLTVFNQGTIDAFAIGLIDYIPAGLILADANWTAAGATATLNSPIPFIAAGGTGATTITFQVDPTFTGTTIVNDSEISMADDDTNPGNAPPVDIDSAPGDNGTPVDTGNNDDVADTLGGDDQDPEMIPVVPPVGVFDLALNKTLNAATPGPFVPGDVVTFDLTVFNQGTIDAFAIGLIDYIPAGLILADANWTAAGATATLNSPIPFIAAGGTGATTITFQVDPTFTGTTIVNDAEVSMADDDTNPGNAPPVDIDSAPGDNGTPVDTGNNDDVADTAGGDDQDPEEISVVPTIGVFDLALVKTVNAATPGPFAPGDVVTFDLTVLNQGTVDAFAIGLIDQIPAGLILADANWTAAGGIATLNNPIPFITAGGSMVVTITFQIDPAFMGTSILNDSEISMADDDTNPGNTPPTDIDSTPGDDANPDDLVNDNDPTAPGDDQDPEMIPVVPPVGTFDLALVKTVNASTPGPFAPGDVVTFDLTVLNQGTIDAFNIGLIDQIPAGLILADANWTAAGGIATLNNPIPFIAAGGSMVVTITFQIDPAFMGTSILNDSEISMADDDTNPGNTPPTDVDSTPGDDANPDDLVNDNDPTAPGDDQDPEMIPVVPPVGTFDLALVKTVNASTPGPFMPGDVVTFDLTVLNQGTIDAFNIGLIDQIPAGLILADANWTAAGGIATLNNPIPFIAAGGSMVVTITFQIDPAFMGTSILNDSEISMADDDTNPGNTPPTDVDSTPGDDANPDDLANNDNPNAPGDDQDPEMIPVVPPVGTFDLALVKTLSTLTPGPFMPGDVVTFDLTVLNQGTIDAFAVGLIDQIPAGLILADANWTAAGTVATLNNPIAFIPAGGSQTVTITFQIDPAFMGTSIVNDSEISMADDDTNPGNTPPTDVDSTPGDDANPDDLANNDNPNAPGDDQDPEMIPVDQPQPIFDLALTKMLSATTPGPFMAGDFVTFDITVFNQGTANAFNIGVVDYIPVGLILADANYTAAGGIATLNSPIAFLAAGASTTVTITFQIDPTFQQGSIINNAEVSTADDDTNPGNTPPTDVDSTPGDNSQPNDLSDDNNPNETDGGDDEDPEQIFVSGVFDLALAKTLNAGTPGPFMVGAPVTFDLTVTNQGTVNAFNVGLIDYIPAGLILNDPNWAVVGPNAVLNNPIPFIPAGGSAVVTITFIIDTAFTGTLITNEAEISMADDDTDPNNTPPTDIDSTPGNDMLPEDDQDDEPIVLPPPLVNDLALVKTVNSGTPGPFAPGDLVTFDIEVFNQGTADAFAINVGDAIPAGLLLNDPNWTVVGGVATLVNPIPFIAAGTSTTITISFIIDPNLAASGSIVNNAEITSFDNDTNPNNPGPTDADSTPGDGSQPNDFSDDNDPNETDGGDDEDPELINVVVNVFDLALTKTVSGPGPFTPGQDVIYTITVFNQGTIDALNIGVTDFLPAGLTLSVNDANGWVVGTGNTLTNVIPGPIVAGASASVSLVLTIDPTFTGSSLINNAEISSDNGNDIDSTPGDNSQPNDFSDDNDVTEIDGGDDEDPELIEIGNCPALVCNDNLQISIGLECFVALTADQLLEAPSGFIDYEIQVFDENGVFVGDTITGDQTGQVLTYQVISPCDGNSCWGEITFEANILPQLFSDCPYIPGDMGMSQGTFSSSSNSSSVEVCKTDPCQQSLIIESLTDLKFSTGPGIWELSGVTWVVTNAAGGLVLSGDLGPEGDSDVEDISDLPIGCYTVEFTSIVPSALGNFKFTASVPSCEVPEDCRVWCGGGIPDGFITLEEAVSLVNNGCAAQVIGDIIVDESVSGDICDPNGTIRVVTYTAKIEMHGVISTVVLASQAFSEERLDISSNTGNTQLFFPRNLNLDCDNDIVVSDSHVFGSPEYIEAITGSGAAAFPSFLDDHGSAVPDTIFTERVIHVERILDTVQVATQQLITDEAGNTSLEWVLLSVVDKVLVDSLVPDTIIPGTFSQPLVPIRDRICNLLVTFEDLNFSSCAGGEKIVREWFVIDWCESGVREVGIQNIEISDQTAPLVSSPDAQIISTDPWTCSGKVRLPELEIQDNCSSEFEIVWTASEGRIVDDYAIDLWPSGDTIHLTANVIDECGNGTSVYLPVFVEDRVPPVMVCASGLQVTLTFDPQSPEFNGGVGRIDVGSFDGGSNDAGCGDVSLQVVRLDDYSESVFDCNGRLLGFRPTSCLAETRSVDLGSPVGKNDCELDNSNIGEVTVPGDFVKFCCADAGQVVRVLLIGTDKNGNSSECVVDVLVRDNSTPTMVCDDVVIDCAGDLDLVDGPRLLGGACEGERTFEVLSEENSSGTLCGAGTIIREYFLDVDGSGNISPGDPFCQQIITLREGSGALDPNTIKWPRHHDGSSFQGVNIECNDDGEVQVIDDFTVNMGDVVTCVPDDNIGEVPTWCDSDCGLVGFSVDTDSIFVSDACLKIIKRWAVVDWCTFDPNGSGVDDDNDSGRDQFEAVEDWAQGVCADCDNGFGPVHGDPVYFRYTQFDPDGFYTFDQVIRVVDDSPAVIDVPDNFVVNTSGGATTKEDLTECTGFDIVNASAQDFCGGNASPGNLLRWVITVSRDGNVIASKAVTGATAFMNTQEGSPGDLHVITWRVTDGCGNSSVSTTNVTFGDETSPVPFCVGGITTTFMESSGCVEIWAGDFDFGSFDNCTDFDDLDFAVVISGEAPIAPGQADFGSQANIRFCCSDFSSFVELDIWVFDSSGNGDFCTVGLVIEDNGNICPEGAGDPMTDTDMDTDTDEDSGNADDDSGETPNTASSAMIAGQILTETGEMIDETTLTINSILPEYPKSVLNSSEDASYAFANNALDFDYSVRAVRDGDDANGLSTLDLVVITRHILGLAELDSPYKVIAADANNDERVSTVDLVTLKSLVLGVSNDLPNNTSWRFVDPDFDFVNSVNPWPFMEQQMIIDLAQNMMNEDFIGVKIGDVNGSVQANSFAKTEIRSSGLLSLNVDEARLERGEQVTIAINSDNFSNYYGFQFTLAHAGLEFTGIEAGYLDVDANSIGIFDDQFTMSWFNGNPVNTDETLFSLVLTATQSVELSEALALNSSITKTEAYSGSNFDAHNIELTFNSTALAQDEFELLQNSPNPFEESTVIGFNLPERAPVNITVYDLTGKVLKQVEGIYSKGLNQVQVNKSDLNNTSGIFYYRLDSGSFSSTKKMILMD